MVARSASRRAKKGRTATSKDRGTPWQLILDVSKYGGKWIATRQGEVLAAGSTLGEIDQMVHALNLDHEVILTKVPRTGDLAL